MMKRKAAAPVPHAQPRSEGPLKPLAACDAIVSPSKSRRPLAFFDRDLQTAATLTNAGSRGRRSPAHRRLRQLTDLHPTRGKCEYREKVHRSGIVAELLQQLPGGSGSSKSGAIHLIFISPDGVRRPSGAGTGTSLAMGRPCLAITISSPDAARSTSDEKLVLGFVEVENLVMEIWPTWPNSHLCRPDGQIVRSTIIFLISAMAFAGLRPLGQVLVQFMMVWQR